MATEAFDPPTDPPPDLSINPAESSLPSTSPALQLPTAYRLGMPFDRRLLLATFTSFSVGTTLGYTTTARLAALRFRAENAHRLPTSNPGWYLYHKSKNYYKVKHGVVAGLRSGAYLAAWTAIFFVLEESMDVFRGTWRAGRTLSEMEGVDELDLGKVDRGVEGSRDWISSTVAGMVTGGLWSVWQGFPMVVAARTIRMGVLAGLGYGLAQDGMTWVRRRYGVSGEEESWVHKGAKNRRTPDEGGE